MTLYEESGISFDFSKAVSSFRHDAAEPNDGNTFWPGVDFRIEETNNEI